MAKIRLDLTHELQDGEVAVFKAPCACSSVDGIVVYYPHIDADNDESAATTKSETFDFADSLGNILNGVSDLFTEGSCVSVILSVTNKLAYIQNEPTRAYIVYSTSTPVGFEGRIWLKPIEM